MTKKDFIKLTSCQVTKLKSFPFVLKHRHFKFLCLNIFYDENHIPYCYRGKLTLYVDNFEFFIAVINVFNWLDLLEFLNLHYKLMEAYQ